MRKIALLSLTTLCAALLASCGGSDDAAVSSTPTLPSSLGADGWASYYASSSGVTKGGSDADAAHTYTVTTRSELIKALYPDAIISADGTFTSAAGPDATAKIIIVKGTISLNTNAAGRELTEADYICADKPYDFESYKAAYNPKTWNKQALTTGSSPKPPAPSGAQEAGRSCASANQTKVVKLAIGSNTSLLGLGADAKIVHGQLSIGDGTDNVVIRNITFEDAFDFFPYWDPTDSYMADVNYRYVQPPAVANPASTYPKCQFVYDAATDNGPHQCPGGRWNSNYDLIGLSGGTHVWIDHCTFSDGDRETYKYPSVWAAPYQGHEYMIEHHDGLVDITLKSNFVTVSNNHFKNHQKTHLIGGSDTVSTANGWGALSVTLHHNFYDYTGERLPRVRQGKVHLYNNYYRGQFAESLSTPPDYGKNDSPRPFIYGIGIGYLAKIYSENNVFDIAANVGAPAVDERAVYFLWHKASPSDPVKDVAKLDYLQNTYFYDSGSTLNGTVRDFFSHANSAALAQVPARPALLKTDTFWKPSSNYNYTPDTASAVKTKVMNNAGVGKL